MNIIAYRMHDHTLGGGKTIDVDMKCVFHCHSTVDKEVTEKFIILIILYESKKSFLVVPCLSFDFIV